jgi:primosomal protein N' (replication factor Y)
MYAEVIVNRSIIRSAKRAFVDVPEDADIPLPELESGRHEAAPPDDNPLALTFHYHVPTRLATQIQAGQLVAVPFRSQQLTAVVVALGQSSPVAGTRPIADILDLEPVLTQHQIDLARWLSSEYIAPLATCVRYFLPPGAGRKTEIVLKPSAATSQATLTAPEQILLTYLRQKSIVPLSEVDLTAADMLVAKGLAYKESALAKPRVGPKIDRMVDLLIPPDEIESVLPSLGHQSKRAELLRYLADLEDPLPPLAEVLAHVGYATKSPVLALAEKGWVKILPKQTKLDVPPGLRVGVTELDTLTVSPGEQKVLNYLVGQGRPVPLEVVLAATGADRHVIRTLVRYRLVDQFQEPERITLSLARTELLDALLELRHAQKQADVLHLLAAEDGPVWIGWVYAQTEAKLDTLRALAQAGLITIDEARRWRDPLAGRSFTLDTPPRLTAEQTSVWQEVARAWRPDNPLRTPILLHGVTGSGKTEIYLHAIAAALRAGQGAIMLVPEITLATQTVERVSARFPGRVAIWHSALSPGERYDTWERVRAGELPIVVGPRSALFAPVRNLGVVVVDEEHEPAYKQRDRPPIFHAREAALELGRLSRALVIMGSATPDVVSYRQAERGTSRLLNLPSRILAHTKHLAVQKALLKRRQLSSRLPSQDPGSEFVTLPLPPVEVVDLREELRAGNRTIFSRVLQDSIRETLTHGEQVILFLNRRGTASFVICRDCGHVMTCPRCDTTLTYHADGELMVCHFCGYRSRTVETCPQCHGERIRFFGLGTQRVEEAVKQMFPAAQTIRWDWDTTRQKGSHHVFLEHFMTGRANMMIGTQMVAKGLDLPMVTLVGVISADTALYLPDFRAAERTFQLLMQVAGRAGRSPLGGKVIIQTYNPDQVAIEAAANHDYEGFYQMELAFRAEQRYPPFKRVALQLYQGPGLDRSSHAVRTFTDRLRRHVERQGLPAVEIIGPTPSYVRRVRNQYRWHVLLRAQDPAAVLRPLLPLPHGWRVDIDPVSLL